MLLIAGTFISACAHNVWLSDGFVNAKDKSPRELSAVLGKPAKVIEKQRSPMFHGNLQEYRYFIVTRSGKVSCRRYIYNGERYMYHVFPGFDAGGTEFFKVIDFNDLMYADQVKELQETIFRGK